MLTSAWTTLVYEPFYNGLIFLSSIVPSHDVGFAIILLTIIVKTALYPLSRKSVRAQAKMKEVEGEIAAIREKHKGDRTKVAQETMALYQRKGINPASGCLPALIQIPFIIGLYSVFLKGIAIAPEHLYGFIPHPESLNTVFLGILPLESKKNLLLALLAAVTQFLYAYLSMAKRGAPTKPPASSQEEFAQAMQMQMRYVFPVMIGFIAYRFSAAVALYWVVGNIVSIVQDAWTRRGLARAATALDQAPGAPRP